MTRSSVSTGKGAVDRPDSRSLIVFFVLVIIGGSNAVAVQFSNAQLPPFWGAAIRFMLAGLIFWLIVALRRVQVPKGRTLIGVLFYGFISVGIAYALLYWALLQVSAGLTMMVLAFVPLLTFFFALLHGQESFRWQSLVGGIVSVIGIAIVAGGAVLDAVPILSILAVVLAAVCFAEANVVFKMFPSVDPLATNAIAMTFGALILFIVSFLAGEQWLLPQGETTWTAFLYLVLIGSVLLFYLYLYVLKRWTASATAYSFLLFPIAATVIGALLLGDEITLTFIVGGALVLAGVWVGAFSRSRSGRSLPKQSAPTD